MEPEFEMEGLTLRFIARQFVSELGALEFGVSWTNAECYFLWCNEWWMIAMRYQLLHSKRFSAILIY